MFPNPPRRSPDGALAVSRRSRLADARLVGLLRGDGGQTFAALALNTVTSLVAGALLGATTDTFERIPGLIVLVPAAIGLRGNVYSAMGSRLSTAIHMGNLRLSLRRESLMGQNILASVVLTMGLALFAAVLAASVGLAFGVTGDIRFGPLVVVSVVGGLIASVVVLGATIGLAAGSVRFSWDLDALVAPVVSTLGDVLTLPALWLIATWVLDAGDTQLSVVAVVVIAATVGVTLWSFWARAEALRSIVRESIVVLTVAVVLSTFAGLALEHQLAALTIVPALLVMVPAFVSSAGSLGGILASRCATLLHLGTIAPTLWPERPVRREVRRLLLIALPVQALNAAGAYLIAQRLDGGEGGSFAALLVVALLGGALAAGFVVFIAYGASVAAYRFGLDPDTYGIPVVTSSVDFVGVLLLLITASAVGLI